jgi:hypothetical protein
MSSDTSPAAGRFRFKQAVHRARRWIRQTTITAAITWACDCLRVLPFLVVFLAGSYAGARIAYTDVGYRVQPVSYVIWHNLGDLILCWPLAGLMWSLLKSLVYLLGGDLRALASTVRRAIRSVATRKDGAR